MLPLPKKNKVIIPTTSTKAPVVAAPAPVPVPPVSVPPSLTINASPSPAVVSEVQPPVQIAPVLPSVTNLTPAAQPVKVSWHLFW